MEVGVKKSSRKAKVSARAVIARINRALAPRHMRLRTSRGWRMKQAAGDYFVINTKGRYVVQSYNFMPLRDIARDVGVLADWEEIDFTAQAA
jgi:hypothetical protein